MVTTSSLLRSPSEISVHVGLEMGGHLGRGDAGSVLLQGLGHLDARLGGFHRVAVDVAPVVEVLDDVVPRGLGAEAVLLHQLDQRALAVPRRRLGLLGVEVLLDQIGAVALVQGGQFGVLLPAVGVVGQPARLEHTRTAQEEGLGVHLEVDAVGFGDAVVGQGRQEAADHQFVELPLAVAQHTSAGRTRGVDGRVVGGAFVTPARRQGLLAQQFAGLTRRTPTGSASATPRAARATAGRPCCRSAGS